MKTLSQVEQLVRRIDDLIGQPGLEAQAAKLAQDYAELGRATSRRLEQCAIMIENGQDLQALQLAESHPPLLDMVTMLSFRQAKEWRGYCQQHNLPWAEPFYDKHVRVLNSTYGKGIASDHAFYRDYRRAIMKGDEKYARSILQVIARLNPGDQNTAQELQRLSDKAVNAALEELRQVLAVGEVEAVLAKLTDLEASGLPIPPTHPVWLQAHLARCRKLLGQAQALREQDNWEETASVLEEIRLLANQNDVPLSPEDTQLWNEMEAWTSGRRSVLVQQQDHQHALEALQYQVESSHNQQANAGGFTVDQVQAELNLLATKRQDLERFGHPLEAELADRYEMVCAALRRRMQRRLKRRRNRKILGALAGLALVVAAAVSFWFFIQQKDTVAQLQSLQSARRVSDTEHLLQRVPALIPPPLQPGARLNAAIVAARQFVAREQELKRTFDQKVGGLESLAAHGFSNALTQVGAPRSECAQALEQLAPEFKQDGQSRLEAFDKLWQDHLLALQPQYNANFEGLLATAEKFVAQRLNLTNGFDALQSALPQAQRLLTNLDKLQAGPLPLDPGFSRRFRELTNQYSLWGGATKRLVEARSLDEYLDGLNQLSGSALLEPGQKEAVDKASRLKARPADLLGALLLPAQPQNWESLATLANARPLFRPDHPSDAEKEAYFKLRDDKNIQEVYAYHLEKRNRPDNALESHNILTQGRLVRNRFGLPAGTIYDPTQYFDQLYLQQKSFDDWDYTNALSLGLTKESALFQNLGLRDLIDPNTGNYAKSILQLLDELSQNNDASAMFRAYVSLRLFEIAELRPVDWGLLWSPGAAPHIQNLRGLGALELHSGDWMIPKQYRISEKPFKEYFAQARTNSLEKQAEFFQVLTRRACGAGFAFAGFADVNGKPVLNQIDPGALEVWGWNRRSSSLVRLLRRTTGNEAWQPVEPLLPFTPLFVFGEDRHKLLTAVAAATQYPLAAAEPFLPPLFSGIYE